MRRLVRATCATALMAAAALAVPLHAAAANNNPVGAGALTMTLSTTSTGLPAIGFTCITMGVSGAGELNVVGANAQGAYAGPVTVSGSYDTCGNATLDTGVVSLEIKGNPLAGDLDCKTSGGSGVIQRVGVQVTSVIAVSCEIGGFVQPFANFVYAGAAVPISVDASGAVDAYTITGPMAFPD